MCWYYGLDLAIVYMKGSVSITNSIVVSPYDPMVVD